MGLEALSGEVLFVHTEFGGKREYKGKAFVENDSLIVSVSRFAGVGLVIQLPLHENKGNGSYSLTRNEQLFRTQPLDKGLTFELMPENALSIIPEGFASRQIWLIEPYSPDNT